MFPEPRNLGPLRDHQGEEPQRRAALAHDKMERDALHECAIAHHHALTRQGAKLYELFKEQTPIRISEDPRLAPAVLTGRWLARGVFTLAVPELWSITRPAFISFQRAFALNAGLTPSGTFEATPWHEQDNCASRYLVPASETLRAAMHAAGQEIAVNLLAVFPDRVNLEHGREMSPADRQTISKIVRLHCEGFLSEVTQGLQALRSFYGGSISLAQAEEDTIRASFLQGARAVALATFKETRLQVAHFLFEHYGCDGPLGALVRTVSEATASSSLSVVSSSLRESPLSAPQLSLLKPMLKAAVHSARMTNPHFAEWWSAVGKDERRELIKVAAREAWASAARQYSRTN